MPKSWTTEKMRKTTTNQAGIALWCTKGKNALLEVPTLGRNEPTAAPRVMIKISGTAGAEKHPTLDCALGRVGGTVTGVVIAAFRPSKAESVIVKARPSNMVCQSAPCATP